MELEVASDGRRFDEVLVDSAELEEDGTIPE